VNGFGFLGVFGCSAVLSGWSAELPGRCAVPFDRSTVLIGRFAVTGVGADWPAVAVPA
jgi:hypothetical protein